MEVTITGSGFGRQPGAVWFGRSAAARIISWRPEEIHVIVPNTAEGPQAIRLATGDREVEGRRFQVLRAPLIPVVVTASKSAEWVRAGGRAFGPLLHDPADPGKWFLTISLPAGEEVELEFSYGGHVPYHVPSSGVGRVSLE